jgi:hypothetical protein
MSMRSIAFLVAFASALAVGAVACATTGDALLGGRERCWSDQRMSSLWRGVLRIDAFGGELQTPEGEVIPLRSGALRTRVGDGGGELVRGEEVVARAGDDVTLFGGAGSDGFLVVCAVEELHSVRSSGSPGGVG